MKQLLQQRASIFIQSIPFVKENADKFPFPDWKYNNLRPTGQNQNINPFQVADGIKQYDGSIWHAVSKGSTYSIVFLFDKIDILCNNPSVSPAHFLKEAQNIITKLAESYAINQVIRFAYAPTYGTADFSWKDLIGKDSFKGAQPEDLLQSFVVCVTEKINNHQIIINNHVNNSHGFLQDGNKVLIHQIDINSKVGQGIFDIFTTNVFFNKAESLTNEFLDYLHIF